MSVSQEIQTEAGKPRIYVISRPGFEPDSLDDFLQHNSLSWAQDKAATQAEKITEVAGRLCYMSFTDDTSKITYPNKRYIQNLIEHGHESVLEHVNWGFIIEGVSRSFTHQLVRHRVGFAYSQLSQQYHDESEPSFIVPFGLNKDSKAFDEWRSLMTRIKDAYKTMLQNHLSEEMLPDSKESSRWLRSLARSVMPNACATKIAVTANARSLRHFLNVRGTIPGDYEMRSVCVGLLKILKEEAPSIFADFEVEVNPDDGEEIIRKIDF